MNKFIWSKGARLHMSGVKKHSLNFFIYKTNLLLWPIGTHGIRMYALKIRIFFIQFNYLYLLNGICLINYLDISISINDTYINVIIKYHNYDKY